MAARRFLLIEAAGSPFEMGYQHGAGHRDLVHASMATYRWILGSFDRPATLEEATALAMESLPDAEAYAPDLVEEVRGIAAGADLPFAHVFSLNASLDVFGALRRGTRAAAPLSCSSYAVVPPASLDGTVYVGWNADDYEHWLASCVLISLRPDDAPPVLTWTFAGFVGRPGIGPHVALAANGLGPSRDARGVPYPFLCRRALAQRSVADAIAVLTSARQLSRQNYMLADADGNVASVEVTGTDYAVLGPTDGWISHTNHILDPRLRAAEDLPELAPDENNTSKRQCRWADLMRERHGRVALADLEAMHRDHAKAPDSICCHAVREGFGMTLCSLIGVPRQRRLLVAYGTPCENNFVEYRLDG